MWLNHGSECIETQPPENEGNLPGSSLCPRIGRRISDPNQPETLCVGQFPNKTLAWQSETEMELTRAMKFHFQI